jgi:methyl-accepting chemotaxis protein
MAIELYVQVDIDKIQAKMAKASFFTAIEKGGDQTVPGTYLFYLRNKFFLLLAVFALMVAIVMIMFVKTLVGPLQYMTKMSNQLLEGDLSTTIAINTKDELGRLAECINDLTSNLQEVVANVDAHRQTLTELTQQLDSEVSNIVELKPEQSNPEFIQGLQEQIEQIKHSLSELEELVSYFKLYRVTKGG